jgi:microcystin-dependent protein
MADYFLGEIRIFSWNWAPKGWALCNGATLPTAQNTALYSLLGTQFGGNGTSNFMLPDLMGRAIVGFGVGSPIVGTKAGAEAVTLLSTNVPPHTHTVVAQNSAGTSVVPSGNYIANIAVPAAGFPGGASAAEYLPAGSWTANTQLAPTAVLNYGGSQPHSNMQPSTVINYSISLTGIYPTRG